MYFWHVPECTQIKAPGGCRFGVCLQTHSKTWCWKEKFCIDWYSHSIKWWTTDATTENQSDDKTQYRVRLSSSRETIRSQKKRNWALHLESSRLDLKISEVQTLQHSKKDLSNGPWAWKKKQGQQLGFYTRTCTRFQVHILTIEIGSSNEVPRTMFLHSQELRRKRETGASLQMMSKRDLFDSRRTGNDSKV